MSFWSNRVEYYKLFEQLIQGNITATTFEREFIKQWKLDRNSNHESSTNSLLQNDTVKDFQEPVSQVFTACDVFNPNPNTRKEHEYDEKQLREFVKNIVDKNKALLTR